MISHEEWLQIAIEAIDSKVFEGDLNLQDHPFQVSWGRCKGKRITETIQPHGYADGEFFPTTIVVDFKQTDPITIMQNLAYECIKAFLGITKGKKFKQTAEKYYFEEPYKEVHCSAYLMDLINEAYAEVLSKVGSWPGGAINFPKKETKKTTNTYKLICPECSMEISMTKKMFNTHNGAMPTCACGTRFTLAESNEDGETETP